MATAVQYRVVFVADGDWLEIAADEIRLEVVATTEIAWNEVFVAAGYSIAQAADAESWVGEVEYVDPRHGAIQVGDLACGPGVNGGATFLRAIAA